MKICQLSLKVTQAKLIEILKEYLGTEVISLNSELFAFVEKIADTFSTKANSLELAQFYNVLLKMCQLSAKVTQRIPGGQSHQSQLGAVRSHWVGLRCPSSSLEGSLQTFTQCYDTNTSHGHGDHLFWPSSVLRRAQESSMFLIVEASGGYDLISMPMFHTTWRYSR